LGRWGVREAQGLIELIRLWTTRKRAMALPPTAPRQEEERLQRARAERRRRRAVRTTTRTRKRRTLTVKKIK